jgi:neutral ceramidase
VESGLELLSGSPFRFTLLTGYAAEWIGYLPTRAAFAEGGYETGPGDWSRLRPGAAEQVTARAARLLRSLG